MRPRIPQSYFNDVGVGHVSVTSIFYLFGATPRHDIICPKYSNKSLYMNKIFWIKFLNDETIENDFNMLYLIQGWAYIRMLENQTQISVKMVGVICS